MEPLSTPGLVPADILTEQLPGTAGAARDARPGQAGANVPRDGQQLGAVVRELPPGLAQRQAADLGLPDSSQSNPAVLYQASAQPPPQGGRRP
jgi:hypothetical protein